MEYVTLALIHHGNRRSIVEAPAFSVKPGDIVGFGRDESGEFTAHVRSVRVVEKDSEEYNFLRDMHMNPFIPVCSIWNKRGDSE